MIAWITLVASVSSTIASEQPIPLRYEQTESILLTATDTERDAIDVHAVQQDGAFMVHQYDRLLHSESPEAAQWNEIPIHFVYFDGQRTIYSAYSPMPWSMYERTIGEEDVALGDSIHLRPCIWPLLSGLIQKGDWEPSEQGGFRLVLDHLSLRIGIDRFGRILNTHYQTDTVAQTWLHSGYDSKGEQRFPTKMKRTLSVADKNGRSLLDETDHYLLSIVENPSDISEYLSFDKIARRSNRIDQRSRDVFSPEGELLYNQDEIQSAYLRSVGLSNPIHTRNILFIIIGVLAASSIVLWKRKSS
jgi:hypothetical protein